MARKFDFSYWLTEDGLNKIRLFSNDGKTKAQIAALMGCGLTTLKKGENEHPEIMKAINTGRDGLLQELEASLYNQGLGYYKTIVEYETVEVGDSKVTKRIERKVFMPPDFRATKFAMENLKPDKWNKEKADKLAYQREKDAQMQKNIDDGKIKAVNITIGSGSDGSDLGK